MKHVLLFLISVFGILSVQSQTEKSIFLNAKLGEKFKTKSRLTAPIVKNKYNFDISPQTGREYLVSQDLFDVKGNIKSSGLFADNGNKIGDVRYTYDASGILQKKELKWFENGYKEITFYQQNKAIKTEFRTKGDTIRYVDELKYDNKGQLSETIRTKDGKVLHKWVKEMSYDAKSNVTQLYEYEIDSLGQMQPAVPKLTIMEYDESNMILQTTVYNNKEKRKMLSWTYYKYQIDNDYRIIKQAGFNDEQIEIHSKEIAYTDSSVTVRFRMANSSKKLEFINAERWIINEYGEPIKKHQLNEDGQVIKSEFITYDQFGNPIENAYQLGDSIKKARTIYEYFTDQVSKGK